MTYEISHLAGIFASREASATIAIHWNIISNGHFPFFIANTSTFTYAYVVVFRFWAENESLFRVPVYDSIVMNIIKQTLELDLEHHIWRMGCVPLASQQIWYDDHDIGQFE